MIFFLEGQLKRKRKSKILFNNYLAIDRKFNLEMRGELVHICECEVCCWLYCKHSQMLVWITWLVNGNSYFVFFFCFMPWFPWSETNIRNWRAQIIKNRVENWKLATFSIITPQNETLKRMKNFVHIFCQTDEARASYTDSMNGCGNIPALHWRLFNHCHQLHLSHNQSNICPIDFSPN